MADQGLAGTDTAGSGQISGFLSRHHGGDAKQDKEPAITRNFLFNSGFQLSKCNCFHPFRKKLDPVPLLAKTNFESTIN